MADRLEDVIAQLRADDTLEAGAKTKVLSKLEAIPSPLQSDPWIYRSVVLFLGFISSATVLGGLIIVATSSVVIPGEIVALGSAAIGALAGLLAPAPSQR